ncbi:MBL fold metallo-hydrolase [Naasia lichenicola]|uniref:MBL fold metallo-hydrolase n=1 Tax=Naasia lichenicola TaxID=2565933 RepID=A0A4S4FJ70_9MICO|nr:MBL fold metallo-hydrolase [Naasia lichenicola]THG29255.1 MBL fold metallo-hydrolase [Naasia lichenicola]
MSRQPTAGNTPSEVAPGVWLIRDTCNVYLIVAGSDRSDPASTGDAAGEGGERTAVAIDFGAGAVLSHLDELGIDRITDVLMTHHHRDQAQGLPLAVAHGARIHVPPVEVELFERVDEMWRMRQLDNDYNLRQDRFSLLEPVAVHAVVPEYRSFVAGGVRLRPIPTPGHTIGSVTYLLERESTRIAFTGDLIYAPGKVWSLAATQWSYTANEGPGMTVLSCHLLSDERPDLLLPSHGRPMADPLSALAELAARMQRYVDARREQPWDLEDRLRRPYVAISPHLLLNRSSLSTGYALLSDTGEALFVDYGYDMTTAIPTGQDRAGRRPWLASLPGLKAQFGVSRISAMLATHYHDDHVAGMLLLRDVEGAELWASSTVAPILADPWKHDLPAQWYDPIVVDRSIPVGETIRWNEYEITVHDQPGHTLFAAAFEVTVDGMTVLFTGDQQEGLGIPGERNEVLNYQYRNRFRLGDYPRSVELYRRIAPGLLLSGHWEPREVEPGYLDFLQEAVDGLEAVHRELLPLDELDLGADGVLCRITPYRSSLASGSTAAFVATVRNPHPTAAEATIGIVVPDGWSADSIAPVLLQPGEEREIQFELICGAQPASRARVAADVTIGDLRLGQHAEALVDVR